jgi:hypothetical protein
MAHTRTSCFFGFWWYWGLNLGLCLALARQVLYSLSHGSSPHPYSESLFLIGGELPREDDALLTHCAGQTLAHSRMQ